MAIRAAFLVITLAAAAFGLPEGAKAQQEQTLADIRQDLNILFVEIQRLKRELSTTNAPSVATGGASVLDRVGAIEQELQRLTAQTEALQHRVEQVVADGTNRIADLEFRLVEAEGGDVSQLAETTTLGGEVQTGLLPPLTPGNADQSQLAVGEQADFDAATEAMAAGDPARAAELFANFNETYPGSPLAAQAALQRGKALNDIGDTREAARAFLESYRVDQSGPTAPDAVLELGIALGKLGKTQEACVTLGEVALRYPSSAAVASARDQMATLSCP